MTKTEKMMRKIRQKAFDFPESKSEQVQRILGKLKIKLQSEKQYSATDYHPFYAAEG
jgi:hypothetical protein